MKRFILKTIDIILTLLMVVSVAYAMFNLTMQFLPAAIQTKVYTWLHMSSDAITTFSISATINAAVIVASKIAQTVTRLKLTQTVTQAEQVMDNDVAVNKIVVDRVNACIDNVNVLQTMLNALLTVQKVTTERNINASEKLVHNNEKEAYKQALQEIEEAKNNLKELQNITSVYEKTEIKEVIVEKPDTKLSGRV